MRKLEISYDPYKMITEIIIDDTNVSKTDFYYKYKDFIDNKIPLQTWIEPIPYLNWDGLVNTFSDPENNDEVEVIFSGRVIDFEDLKRSINVQNEKRLPENRVKYTFKHKIVKDDKTMSDNIEYVVKQIKSDRFKELVKQRSSTALNKKYEELDENYKLAKENEFYIVFSGTYSSGKSTLLNTLIRHNVLPTSNGTCTSKNCKIRHDKSLGKKISMVCYDKNDKIVIPKKVFDSDLVCAAEFLKISPIQDDSAKDAYPNVATMELGVDLSHLYPDGASDDKFTIVLIDTPGVDSSQSITQGKNKHAEIAMDAISMESKPMIVLVVDANGYENKSIGEFMKEILAQSKEDNCGFNDRFLFLMNKCDRVHFSQNESPETTRNNFSKYLVDYERWNITDEEQKQIAESASHFVPRVFMTSASAANAIQCKVYDCTEEELNANEDKTNLFDDYENFRNKICGHIKRIGYYLSRYCDNPNYRKEELEEQFNNALENDDHVTATKLQCGVVSVETAIKDYIERYAYPIKVRELLYTFEDILEDVTSFTDASLESLKQAENRLGNEQAERREANQKKEGVEEKTAKLKDTEEKINQNLKALDDIQFDSLKLKKAINDFDTQISRNKNIIYIRENKDKKIYTGQKSHKEVTEEINKLIIEIKQLFESNLIATNKKITEISNDYRKQIDKVFDFVKKAVAELEKSGALAYGKFNFKNSLLWKTNFSNINTDKFYSEIEKTIKDKDTTKKVIQNAKKVEWKNSSNPFKKFGALFFSDTVTKTEYIEGYYEVTDIVICIDNYLQNFLAESKSMDNSSKDKLNYYKNQVRDLINLLIKELEQYHMDIKNHENKIRELEKSIKKLEDETQKEKSTYNWLNELKNKLMEE